MRAYVMTRYGGPEVMELREVPEPRPGPGELLVTVHAAGLNPVDFKIRQGKLRVIRGYPFPMVMGNELAGVVEAVGPGVTRFAAGDRVFARVAKETLGAFAEQATVAEAHAARLPASIDFERAAGVPLAGLTALQGLRDELQVAAGQRLFVSGGAGGVGTFALQLAKGMGAHVITTASPRGEALVRRLGADEVIDYTRGAFEESLHDVDAVLDLVGADTLTRSLQTVKRGGRVVSIAGPPEPQTARKDLQGGALMAFLFWMVSAGIRRRARGRGVSYRYLFMHPDGAALAELAALIEAGRLEVVLDRVFPLAEIDQAFAHLEGGHAKGKIVVTMR